MNKLYLIYEGEYDYIIKGIFTSTKTFVRNYSIEVESRPDENNKNIHNDIKEDEISMTFSSNLGEFTELFYYSTLEVNKIY